MTKRGLTLVNAMHITASVFINDDWSRYYERETFSYPAICEKCRMSPVLMR
jgi:hypothetical protein